MQRDQALRRKGQQDEELNAAAASIATQGASSAEPTAPSDLRYDVPTGMLQHLLL